MQKNSFVLISLFTVLILLLAACGGGSANTEEAAPAQDTGGTTQATEAPAEGTSSGFFLQIAKVVGTVEVRDSTDGTYAPAEVGQRLTEGMQIRTGADGILSLYRDAFTMVVVDNNSEVEIKTLAGTAEVPVTVIALLTGAAALDHHAEKLPEGSVFSIETPEGNTGKIIGSTVRVQYNPETKVMTATCLTGSCEFVRGEQKLTLEAGQAVDVQGLQPPPGAPEEMSVEQANQFLAMGSQLCGCEITIGEIRDGGLAEASPAPENLGESGDDSSSSDDSGNSNELENSNDSGSESGDDSGGGEDSSGGDD
ncbi:MAG: hypothetical protein FJ031_10120 [Chloroflexi bacterium]|nr:hypothetical protein [Chloroflexota bacterium]